MTDNRCWMSVGIEKQTRQEVGMVICLFQRDVSILVVILNAETEETGVGKRSNISHRGFRLGYLTENLNIELSFFNNVKHKYVSFIILSYVT